MTIKETQDFYDNDKKNYILKNNIEFLKWFNRQIKQGYKSYLDIKKIQELVKEIVNWYEIKYPDRKFECDSGVIDRRFEDIIDISNYMDMEQLRYRLGRKELEILDCNYRSHSGHIDDKGNYYASFKIGSKRNVDNEEYLISINGHTGIIKKYGLDLLREDYNFSFKEDIDIYSLYEKLKNIESLDLSELEELIFIHNTDLELRNKMFNMIYLALIYSKNTIPEFGYKRALHFKEEFSNYFDLVIDSPSLESLRKSIVKVKRK